MRITRLLFTHWRGFLPAPALLPPLLAAQKIPALLLRLPVLAGEALALGLLLLPLELEGLLGLGADAGGLGLPPGQALGPLGADGPVRGALHG